MAYLNVDLDYFTNRKVVRLVGLLGPQHAVTPIRLWAYVGKHHCEDGALKGYSKQEIESILQWKGKRGDLVDALVKVGFLDINTVDGEDTYQVHDWLEHAGHLAALKIRGKRNAEKRWSKLAEKDATSIPGSTAAPILLPPNLIPTIPPNLTHSPPLRPVDKKCAAHEKEGPCQDYAVPGSKYCTEHREFYRTLPERMAGKGL